MTSGCGIRCYHEQGDEMENEESTVENEESTVDVGDGIYTMASSQRPGVERHLLRCVGAKVHQTAFYVPDGPDTDTKRELIQVLIRANSAPDVVCRVCTAPLVHSKGEVGELLVVVAVDEENFQEASK